MSLHQDISPINSELMDTLVSFSEEDWIPQPFDPERAFMRILWVGSEAGSWAVHFRWLKGFTAPQQAFICISYLYFER